MKITCIGNFPPRICGIATFTQNLTQSILGSMKSEEPASEIDIVAMNDTDQIYNYPKQVKFQIRQNHQNEYIEAANFVNYNGSRVCIIEHEFGIFGGDNGIYILSLIHRINIPIIITLHTVLEKPSFNEKAIIREFGNAVDKLVIMSKRAIEFLVNIYEVPENKIVLIEHGVPGFRMVNDNFKKKYNLQNRKALLTFGLLSRNKGIETVIKALPAVVEKHPDIIYIILGATHPSVKRVSGEEYRDSLKLMVKANNLDNHVLFQNNFVTEETLFEYLKAIDIYITPYLNEAQVTSGTLAYAVGAGAAVISTPYWHAQELLADGRGKLFGFNDSSQLADILFELLDNPEQINKIRDNAYKYGQHILWPIIGDNYYKLVKSVMNSFPVLEYKKKSVIDPQLLPPFDLSHIKHMTDVTGIIQHAKYGIPNLKEGYCLDDNSRALIMLLMAYRQRKEKLAFDMFPIVLSYIRYMQNEDGSFKNFLSFSRQFLDERSSEDCFGRTIWSLGYLIRYAPTIAYKELGLEVFYKASDYFDKLTSLRGKVNTIIGICHYLKCYPADERFNKKLRLLTNDIIKDYKKESTADWHWFEPILTYDNAIIPLALLHVSEITREDQIHEIALESMNFLDSVHFKRGWFAPVGNEGWFTKGGECAKYAQQAVDVMASVLMYHQAYIITRKDHYLKRMFSTFMWFLGENDLRIHLYDYETCGCCDGLESFGVNRNQGAESTLAYLIAHLSILSAYEESYK